MTPRPYQLAIREGIAKGWRDGFRRQLVVAPTGSGKTITFAFEAQAELPRRTLILAHREELIDQAIAKLRAATGVWAQKEKAEWRASLDAPVVVASIQTMIRRLDKWPADHFGLVVADEAHHVLADSWLRVLRHFDGTAKVIGVTATPDRGDKKNLGNYFENIAAEVGLFDLINQRFLSRITLKSIPLAIRLDDVRQTAGDFNEADLGSVLEPYLDEIAAAIRDHASFRRALAFLPLRATSRKFVDACRSAGLTAEHIDGESEDRQELLARFAAGEFDVLSNAMLLTEGYDDPGIDCVVVLRPTRSRPLYAQMVGRGTRIQDAKENLLLLDFLWMHERLSVVHPASLIAKSEEEAAAITSLAQEKGQALPGEVAEALELDLEGLATEAQSKREEALRKRLEEQRNKKAKTISAEEFALRAHQPDLAEYEPTMKWERDAVTEKQAKVLRRAGIDLETVKGKGHASRLIGLYFDSKPVALATHGQRWRMKQAGCSNWQHATAAEAREFFRQQRQPRRPARIRSTDGFGVWDDNHTKQSNAS